MSNTTSAQQSREPVNLLEVCLRCATEQVIRIRRTLGEEGDELRADVLSDLKQAMADGVSSLEMIEVQGEVGPQRYIGIEEYFRGVLAEFGLDGLDSYIQESVYETVRRILDELLAGDAADRTN